MISSVLRDLSIAPPESADPSVLPARDALPFAEYAAPFLPFLERQGQEAGFLRARHARAVVAMLDDRQGPPRVLAEALPVSASVPRLAYAFPPRPSSPPELVLRPSIAAREGVMRRALYLLALRAPALAFPGGPCSVSFAPDPALAEALARAGFRDVPSATSFRVMEAPGPSSP